MQANTILIGFEVYNKGDRYPGDRRTWDRLLAALMPEGRPVWGFSSDDMHRREQLGRNWNVLLLPELSAPSVRDALENGRFLFVYAPAGHDGPPAPHVKSIKVDPCDGIISIEATGYDCIEWVCAGDVVARGESAVLSQLPSLPAYIRAELRLASPDGDLVTGTQPFGIKRLNSERVK